MSRAFVVAAVLASIATPGRALANGRFPAAQYVLIGPAAASDTIVLRATFGLVVSHDRGATFHWICEEALQYSGVWDAAVALSSDGTISVGIPDGLIQTVDACTETRNASASSSPIVDLSADPSGVNLVAVQSAPGSTNHVLASADRGATFTTLGAGLTGIDPTSVEAAPSSPLRVYVTATDETTRAPRIFRSDDGGATLTPGATDFHGALDAYVAAVDPTNRDRVFVRGNADAGSVLLVSTDGAMSFSLVTRTTGPMLGFAISDDARRVWIGGPDDGLSRSDDGGMTFTPVASTHVACLRWHAGSLYVCADWLRESFALERWDDGASTPVPLLQFNQIQGPFACAPGTVENDTCGMRWPMQLTALQPRADAGHDAATDAAIDAPADSNVSDVVDVGSTGAEPSPHATCGCRSVGAGRSGLGPIVAWLLAMACARRRSQRATAGSAG